MKKYSLQLHGDCVKFTRSAETLALEQTLVTCFMMKSFLCELLNKEIQNEVLSIKCYVHNKLLVDSIFSTKTATKTVTEK